MTAAAPSAAAVLVVGCGPVGMTLANLLGLYGIRTLVLEQGTGLYDLPRAVGTDCDCLRAWQAVGLAEKLLPDMTPSGPGGVGMVYLDPDGQPFLEVRPSRREYGFALGYGFIQPLVDRALLAGLDRFDAVEVRFGHRVDRVGEEGDAVRVEGEDAHGRPFRARADYVVACDGGRSRVRGSLGVGMRGSGFRQDWLILDTLEPESPERNVCDVKIWCDPGRPAVCIPRLHGHRRWEFLALPGERADELLDPARIRALLARHTDPADVQVTRKVVHTFQARIAERFRVGRVLLAGDAAHVTPPFAGQGLAIGIRDAFNLAWKLACVVRGDATPALLDTYPEERSPHAWASILLALRLGRIMVPRGRRRALLMARILRLAQRHERLGAFLREGGPKPEPRFRSGFFVRSRGGVAGSLAHQPVVRSGSGERVRLDDALGPGFALLGFGVDPEAMLSPGTRGFWRGLGTRPLQVGSTTGTPGSAPCVEDVDGALEAWLGHVGSRVLLLRPDRVVAADCDATEADTTLSALQSRLLAARP